MFDLNEKSTLQKFERETNQQEKIWTNNKSWNSKNLQFTTKYRNYDWLCCFVIKHCSNLKNEFELEKLHEKNFKNKLFRCNKQFTQKFRSLDFQKHVTNMSWKKFRLSFILSTRILMWTSVDLTYTFTFDIRSSCTYLFFKSNILVMLFIEF